MNEHADPRHDALLDELRALGRVADPLPERVAFAAKASLSWRTIDAELAELTYDSVLDDDRLALVRGHQAGRLLTFTTPALTIEVQVTSKGTDRRLAGHLAPAQPAVLLIRHAGGTSEAEVDADGRFRTEPLPAGPLALVCRVGDEPDGPTVQTEWVTL
jgi:hypothetical protein